MQVTCERSSGWGPSRTQWSLIGGRCAYPGQAQAQVSAIPEREGSASEGDRAAAAPTASLQARERASELGL